MTNPYEPDHPDRCGSTFTDYLALGDSMSIDKYPLRDLVEGSGASFGRFKGRLGAAALLHRNLDEVWPEFQATGLTSLSGELILHDYSTDGACTEGVLSWQVPRALSQVRSGRALVTLTIGGNDLLGALSSQRSISELEHDVEEIGGRIRQIIDELARRLETPGILLTTVYDPTDGTGFLPGLSEMTGKLPIHLLHRLNNLIREIADRKSCVWLADVHRHFLGRGTKSAVADRWYWRHSIIEPSARGASEIRRVWLDALRVQTSSTNRPDGE